MATGRTGEPEPPLDRNGRIIVQDVHTLSSTSFARLAFLNLENAGNRQIFVVYGEREPWWCSFRRAMLTHQLAVENRVGERII